MKTSLGITLLLTAQMLANGFAQDQGQPPFRIRTITAGINLQSLSDTTAIQSAVTFLRTAKNRFETAGYEVQTLRIATQPLREYLNGLALSEATSSLRKLDELAVANNVLLALGPALGEDEYGPEFAEWAANLIKATRNASFSVVVASAGEIRRKAIKSAAEAMLAISKAVPGGEGNFRFTAIANCPPNIPFFPAAYHEGNPSFAIGLESPGLLKQAFQTASSIENAKVKLKNLLETHLREIEVLAVDLARTEKRGYSGIDASPAPGLDASIAEAIETLSQTPFGDAATLQVCAAITDVLKNLTVKTCGYSGLMLPVIEDKILAKRATENRFTVKELLLYSSVSGTGLDVVPLPGETSTEKLFQLIADLSTLSVKLSNKPLSARLFLIPGKQAGDMVTFNNPYLTDCTVMKID